MVRGGRHRSRQCCLDLQKVSLRVLRGAFQHPVRTRGQGCLPETSLPGTAARRQVLRPHARPARGARATCHRIHAADGDDAAAARRCHSLDRPRRHSLSPPWRRPLPSWLRPQCKPPGWVLAASSASSAYRPRLSSAMVRYNRTLRLCSRFASCPILALSKKPFVMSRSNSRLGEEAAVDPR